MNLKFNVTFRNGTRVVASVEGKPVSEQVSQMTLAEITQKAVDAKLFLEQLTGLRVDVNAEQVS